LDATNQLYPVNWDTKASALNLDKYYRIQVFVGTRLLGFADVDSVAMGSGLKNTETNKYITLVDGRTLPIKVRIEKGTVGNVTVSPASATVNVGETEQSQAAVRDLHGQPTGASDQLEH